MDEEVFLVSPNAEYKDTYLEGMKELETDALKNSNSGEFTQDLDEARADFDKYVSQKLNKEKPEDERISLYDIIPEEEKVKLSDEEKEMYKGKKTKPGASFWIMKKDEAGKTQFIGSLEIRPSRLDELDFKNGAAEFAEWKGCLGKNAGVGVETSSFLIPSARGKGYLDMVRGEFMEKLKEKGIDSIVSKVVPGNAASHKKQKELVDFCGGTSFERKSGNEDVTRYIINVNPEAVKQKMAEKLKIRGKLGKIRGLNNEQSAVKPCEADLSLLRGKALDNAK